MTWHRIGLPVTLPAAHAPELSNRIYFISESITDFALEWGDGGVCAVTMSLTPPATAADISAKLGRLVTEEVLPQRVGAAPVVWRSPHHDTATEVFTELVERGHVSVAGEGQVTVDALVADLMSRLDARLRAMAHERFGAREYRYPTLIATETMRRCGYFGSFPQFLMLVTRLHADVDGYREAHRADEDPGFAANLLRYCSDTSHCLPPTMCYHTYHQLSGSLIPADGMAISARGKSFRHESRYHRTLERLWDFTIRETVFLGGREHVLAQRQAAMDLCIDLVTGLGLAGHCEVANDPFFGHVDAPSRAWSQRLLAHKYELRVPVAPDRTCAVASFNVHGQLFGTAFDIRRPSGAGGTEPAATACSGVGLERLAYAFLCQHGVDPEGWPPLPRTNGAPT